MSVAAGALLYQEPGKVPSVVLAVVVHVLLAVFLFFGVHWQSRQPEAVMVELWNSPPAPAVEKVVAQPEPLPKPEVKPEIKPEPKVEKAVEPPKPDIALEKKKKEVKKEPPKKEEPKKEPAKKPEPKLNLDRSKDIRAQAERETTAALNQELEKNRILDQMKREAATFAARESRRRVHRQAQRQDQEQHRAAAGHPRQPGGDLRCGATAHRRSHVGQAAQIERSQGV